MHHTCISGRKYTLITTKLRTIHKMGNEFDDSEWRDAVVSTLKGTDSSKANLKDLRRLVLISLQCDESDKSAKKHYKRTIKSLEEEGTLTLDADGKVKLKKKKKRKSDKDASDEKKKKKRKKDGTNGGR